MIKLRVIFTALFMSMVVTSPSIGDLLGNFTFEGDSLNASSVDPDLTISPLAYVGDFGGTLGFTDGNPGAPNRAYANASNWPTDPVTLDDYYVFTMTSAPGFVLDLQNITFDHRRSSSSPQQWLIYYDFGLGPTLLESGTHTVSGWQSDVVANDTTPMGGVATMEIRVYGNNARSTAGNWRLDNVRINGSMEMIPEPFASHLFGLGTLLLFHVRKKRRKQKSADHTDDLEIATMQQAISAEASATV